MIRFLICLAAVFLLVLPVRAADRPYIVTTTAQVADMVRAIAGDHVTVEHLMGEGVDPHLYRLTRSDTAKMLKADAVFCNGLLLEGKMTDALQRMADSGRKVFCLGDGIDKSRLTSPPEFAGHHDPHIWMDASLWASAIPFVQQSVETILPDMDRELAAGAAAYWKKLSDLDSHARKTLATIPTQARILVTAHDAFGYLGRAYGLEVRGIQGISTDSEAGLKQIEDLVTLLVEKKIPAVFVETSVSDRTVRALVEGARARGHNVRIGGTLYSDALGAPGTCEGTYAGMIDHNVRTIAQALGGPAVRDGFAACP
ncbi:MAG: zinc ABC transporter substrate-binding protein [Pseudomonadota bacterium]|nr:zinc ABC transporter substrate-binding protein [Pseudomonadota bacterium]